MSKRAAKRKEGREGEPEEAVTGETYKEKIPTVQAIQFDGENGDDIVSFVGGDDYAKASGAGLALTPGGKDPRGVKLEVARGQWVVKSDRGVSVVNEGEFSSKFVKEDEEPIDPLEPLPLDEPIPEDQLVYQPGFKAPTSEENKAPGDQVAEPESQPQA